MTAHIHPIQPLAIDDKGTLRFQQNAIVRHLLDNGGIDMNALARLDFSREDREQFAQLIGYSHSGAGELGYFSDEVWNAALAMYEEGESEEVARLRELSEQLAAAKKGMAAGVAALFGIHADDLGAQP